MGHKWRERYIRAALTRWQKDILMWSSVPAALVDELIVAVLKNNAKTPLFSVEERVKMLEDVTRHIPNVRVESFCGLSVEFARQRGARALVRGLRAVTDFEYELQMAQTNRSLQPEIDTLFLRQSWIMRISVLRSWKRWRRYGGDISGFVPPLIADQVYDKIASLKDKEGNV